MSIASFAAFFGTMLILAVVPGPSDVAVVARAATVGTRQALLMIGGIITADLLFILVAVASLNTVARELGGAALWIRLASAGFLIALGVLSWRAAPAGAPSGQPLAQGASSFASGLLMTLADPKALLFYLALFPVFFEPRSIGVWQTIMIMLVTALALLLVKGSYAVLAQRAALLFANDRARIMLNKLAGGTLILLGIALLLPLQSGD